jgi:hypothetical protein
VSGKTIVSILKPAVFRFRDPDNACEYWSGGEHIVADGVCRCGKSFFLARKEPLFEAVDDETVN